MPINHPAIASAGVIAISVAVAAAIAVYESPELRRMAEDLRRKIALAFHSFGDVIEPNSQHPLFNRPEDAEGFLQSRGSADPGVVADEETLRRQREELMYWNALQLEKQARELQQAQEEETRKRRQSEIDEKQAMKSSQSSEHPQLRRGTTFDDFLSPARNADAGTFVFNTGANFRPNDEGLVQRRPGEASRGLHASVFSNPFSDDHRILDEQQASYAMMAPDQDELPDRAYQSPPAIVPIVSQTGREFEITSDIYDDVPTPKRRLSVPEADAPAALPDWSQTRVPHVPPSVTVRSESRPESPSRSATLDRTPEVADERPAAQRDLGDSDAFASIQAWAQSQNSNPPGFYSPIPVSPAAPLSVISEPDVISRGELTPTDTDSLSVAGSGVDVANEVNSKAGDNFDVMSDSTGMATPASWSEVGSVISEDDHPIRS